MRIQTHLEQLGGATTWSLLERDGFDPYTVQRAIRTGALVRVRRGSFVAPEQNLAPELAHARRAVSVARARTDDVLSHVSALAAHALPVLHVENHKIHLLHKGGGRTDCPDSGVVVHGGPAIWEDLPRWEGVQSVPVALAIAQTAIQLDEELALVSADAALRRSVCSTSELMAAARGVGLRRGRKKAEWVAGFADSRSESPGETLCRVRLAALKIPAEPQVDIHDDEGFVGRVDFLDEENRTVLEFDGAVKYAGADGKLALAAEKRREDRLRRAGYKVVRLTWSDLRIDRFARLVHSVRAA